MTKIINSNKFTDVAGALATLKIDQEYSILDIVNTILQITNLQEKTKHCLKMLVPGCYGSSENTFWLKDLKVKMSYQRAVRLRKITNKLVDRGGFDKDASGAIDVAIRPNGDKFVWDGFRRCIMAGICSSDRIEGSKFMHDTRDDEMECEEKEAKLFKIRNADSEKMAPEEIFKSKIVYKDPQATELLTLLKKSKLDVLGLNPSGKTLGGFVKLENLWKSGSVSDNYFISASSIIQNTFKDEGNVSGYLLVSLAYLLTINDEIDNSWLEADIEQAFKDWYKTQDHNSQKDITRDGKTEKKWIAYIIAKRVLNDTNGLLREIGLSDDEEELLEIS